MGRVGKLARYAYNMNREAPAKFRGEAPSNYGLSKKNI